MGVRTAIALGLALIAGGLLFGASPLFAPGVALLVLPLAASAWVLGASLRASLDRRPPAGALLEGQRHPLLIAARCGPLPPPGGEIEDPLLSEPLRIGPGSRRSEHRAEVRFERRGRRSLGSARLTLRDPLGFARRSVRSRDGGELVVLPRIEPIEPALGGAGGHALGAGERGLGGSGPQAWAAEFEIDGLRPYREGSPAARIHWPAYARTGELHERRITSGADAARLVVMDPQRPAGERELDAAVRAAASICHALAGSSGCAVLVGGEARRLELEAGLRNFDHAHHLLALVEADAGLPALQRIGRAGIVFWVSADPSRGAEQRLRRLPAARRLLVRPAPAGPGPVLFRVAGCEAVELEAAGPRPAVAAGSGSGDPGARA